MKIITDSKRWGFIFAILIPFIALGLQWVLWRDITPFVWFFFFPAVFFSARLGGLRGGLAATFISVVLVWYFFIPPQLSWEVANPTNLYSVAVFLVMGYLFSEMQERLNAAYRRTRLTLSETEEHNRITLYSIGDCVITTDARGRVWQMNPAAEKLTGWSEAEAIGKPIGDVFHIVNEATRLEGENPVERVLQEGKVVGLANHTLLIARDGREYPIADNGAPIRHLQGEITGVVLVFRDQSAERTAQNALRESERKFRETISSLDEGFYWTTMDGALLEHNPAFNRIFGFEVTQDLRGTKPPDFWQNPDDRNAYMAQLMGEGVIRNYLIDAKKIDGTKIVVITNTNLVKNETGQPVRIEGVFTDITERKQAEETILASEARYRHTLDAMLEGCQILGFDWRYLYLNDVADVHNRRPKEELLGKRYMDMWPGIESTQVFAVIRRCLEERVVQSMENQFEFPDGSQGWFELRIFPVPEGIVILSVDITERKQAEGALRESEERFRSLYENSTIGLYRTSPEGRILMANPALVGMLGFTTFDDLASRNLEKDGYAPHYSRQEFLRTIESQEEIRGLESAWERGDGSNIFVRESARVIRDGQGRPLYYEGTVEDITERKQAEEIRRESEERYRSLFENMLNGFAYCKMIFDGERPQDFIYLEVNRAFESLTGLSGVVGKKVSEVIPGIRESDPELLEIYGRVALTGQPEAVEIYVETLKMWFSIAVYSPRREYFVAVFDVITERKHAEEVLRQSENTVRAWLDAIQESAFLMDREGIVLAANATVAQRLHRSVEELVGASIYDIIPPQTAHARRLHVAQVIESGQPVRFEDERSGRIIDNIIYPVFDQSGQVKHMAVLGTDITERKQAESAMTKMRTLLNETQEISKIGGWEYDIAAGRVFWTDEVYRLHGVSKEYDPGNPAEDMQFYAPEDQKTIDEAFQLAVEAGAPYDLELQLITAAGEKLWVRTMGRAEIKDGKVVRVSGNIMDITERKQAEEQIRRLNKELEATVEKRTAQLKETLELNQKMIEASSLGIFACQAEGPCIIANPAIARISGTTVEKMLQLNFRELQSWKKNGLFDMAETALTTGEEQRAESYLTTAFGKNVWLNYYFTTFTSNGRLHFMMLVDDITERKQAGQALQQRTTQLEAANQELEAFAYSVSHDLRAPLRALDGFSAVLLTSYSDKLDEQGRHYLDRIRNASQRMGQLIEDLLGLSRITRATFNLQPADLSALADEIAAELQKRDPQRQAEFIIAPNMTTAADSHLLRILLQNLLENAWKFTGKRETTHIAVGCLTAADFRSQHAGLTSYLPEAMASNPESVIYFVRDNGVGFDMTYADKLFTPFQRLHSLQEFPGTGIGLAIVQRIVARHGGSVWAEAQVDQGATFYFAFGGI